MWRFFGNPVTWLGTFYPKSFLTAVVPSLDAAQAALKALRDAGFAESEAIAASGTEMLDFFRELAVRNGVWGELMVRLSRTIGTEQLYVDLDVRQAREGAGFLLVYSPEEAEAQRVLQIITPFGPVSMRRYLTGAVEGMVKAHNTSGPER